MLKNKKKLSQLLLLFFTSVLSILMVTKSVEAKCWKNQWGVKICDFEKPAGTPLEPILDTLDKTAIPPGMQEYIRSLEAQAQGKKQSLPSELVSAISGQYNIDLSQVRYATGINTGHGQAITIGNNIYFPSSVDLSKFSQLNWMLHELEHVSQYEAHGGITPFLVKYVVQGGIQIFSRGHFNIHDNIGLERDAENKADRIDSEVATRMRSSSQPTADEQDTSSDGRHVAWSNNLGDRITSHREMPEGSFLQSGDGRWKMVVQGDGNLVVYQSEGNIPIWASNTGGQGAYPFKLAVQSDGNVVIYGTDRPTWATNTNGVGTGPYTLVMQDDANLVLYDQNGPIWATDTCCR